MVSEYHPPVGGHVVGAVVEDFGRGGVIVAGTDDFHFDQPRIKPEPDDVGAARCDHDPDRVDRLVAEERDDGPGESADHGNGHEEDLVPKRDGERLRMATGGRSASARTQLACPERSSIRFDGVGAATVTSLNHGCDLR